MNYQNLAYAYCHEAGGVGGKSPFKMLLFFQIALFLH